MQLGTLFPGMQRGPIMPRRRAVVCSEGMEWREGSVVASFRDTESFKLADLSRHSNADAIRAGLVSQ